MSREDKDKVPLDKAIFICQPDSCPVGSCSSIPGTRVLRRAYMTGKVFRREGRRGEITPHIVRYAGNSYLDNQSSGGVSLPKGSFTSLSS